MTGQAIDFKVWSKSDEPRMRLQGLESQLLELVTWNTFHTTPGGLFALEGLFQILHCKVMQRGCAGEHGHEEKERLCLLGA